MIHCKEKEVITIEFMTVNSSECYSSERMVIDLAESTQIASGVASKVLLLCRMIIIRLYISFLMLSESVLF